MSTAPLSEPQPTGGWSPDAPPEEPPDEALAGQLANRPEYLVTLHMHGGQRRRIVLAAPLKATGADEPTMAWEVGDQGDVVDDLQDVLVAAGPLVLWHEGVLNADQARTSEDVSEPGVLIVPAGQLAFAEVAGQFRRPEPQPFDQNEEPF